MNAVAISQEKYRNVHQKRTSTQIRNKFRKNFLNTLQEARRRSVDARRFMPHSTNADPNCKIYSNEDLRKILMDHKALLDLISPEEVDEILIEVETEIGLKQSDPLNLYDAEIQAILDNLLTTCTICDQNSTTLICSSCANEHFTDSL